MSFNYCPFCGDRIAKEIRADLEAAMDKIKELSPYQQLFFARNPFSEPLTPFTDQEVLDHQRRQAK